MQIDSLLVGAVAQILKGETPSVQEVIPEIVGEHSGDVRLGQPKEAEKRVRARLAELRKEDLVELQERYAEVEAEMNAEKEVAKAGEFNLRAEMKAGTSRDELAAKRAAAEIAQEAVYIHQEALDEINDQMDRVKKAALMRDQRVVQNLQSVRTSFMVYLQAYCGGDASVFKLNNERVERAYATLLYTIDILTNHLKDDELVKDVMREVTTFTLPGSTSPGSYPRLLWHFLVDRTKGKFEGSTPDDLDKLLAPAPEPTKTKSTSKKKGK